MQNRIIKEGCNISMESDSEISTAESEEDSTVFTNKKQEGHSKRKYGSHKQPYNHKRNKTVRLRVRLRHYQLKILQDGEWEKMIEEVERGLNTVCKYHRDAPNICISSFDKDGAERAKQKIINYLKHFQWDTDRDGEKSADFKLFVNYVEEGIRNQSEHECPSFKAKLFTVKRNSNELKTYFNEIGHEQIDFNKISAKDGDRKLMIKGLDSQEGKDFIKTFESKHDCCVIVSNNSLSRSGKSKCEEIEHKNLYRRGFTKTLNQTSDSSSVSEGEEDSSADIQESTDENESIQTTTLQTKLESLRVDNTELILVQGEIVKQEADALVNIVSPSHNMKDSVVAKAFVECGGPELVKAYDAARKLSDGIVVKTSSCGDLKCSAVFHVALQKGKYCCKRVINQVITWVLDECIENGYKSVAFPPLGIGKMYRYPPDLVAERMLAECKQLLGTGNYRNIEQITFVIYDEETYMIFEKKNKSCHSTTVNDTSEEEDTVVDLKETEREKTDESHSNQRRHYRHKKPDSPRSERRLRGYKGFRHKKGDRSEKSISKCHETQPVQNMAVFVFAENKDSCKTIRNDLGRTIKEEFLHEKGFERKPNISEEKKRQIMHTIMNAGIDKPATEKGMFVLRGEKSKVTKAHAAISKLMQPERGTSEFVKFMVKKDPEIPSYWTKYLTGANLRYLLTNPVSTCEITTVEGSTFNTIEKMVNSTFDHTKIGKGRDAKGLDGLTYTKLAVLKVERIENPYLYKSYAETRQDSFRRLLKYEVTEFPKIEELPNSTGPIMTTKLLDDSLNEELNPEINEVFLFHGTSSNNVGVICTTGFDQRLGNARAMLGVGIYGAECSSKADQYTDDRTARTGGHGEQKKMFLVRMLLGNCYLCKEQNPHKYKRPPCTTCFKDDCREMPHLTNADQRFGPMYDSVVADIGKLYREFVVYDSSMVYPEYLITYERI